MRICSLKRSGWRLELHPIISICWKFRTHEMSDHLSTAGRKGHHEEPLLNRSLERGIEILRAFRPGADLLGNGDIAERTGLSRATVSRLTQTLVAAGILQHDRVQRAYRLAPMVLSLAHAMRSGSPVMQVAAPLMRKAAESLRINVGLAVADRDEMVYLESVRYNRKVALRSVVAGQRVPIELTSLGFAYLSSLGDEERQSTMTQIADIRPASWQEAQLEIQKALLHHAKYGFCVASWQPEVVAIAAPLCIEGHPVLALNMSLSTPSPMRVVAKEMGPSLLRLRQEITSALALVRF